MLQLEFTEKRKPTILQTRQRNPLNIFQDALERQIECVQAAIQGKTITQSKYRYIGGIRTTVEVPIPKWYWIDEGVYYINLKYSTQTIHVNGHPTIKCGDYLETVKQTLEVIMVALNDKEPVIIDAVLAARSRTCWRKRPSGTVSDHRQ